MELNTLPFEPPSPASPAVPPSKPVAHVPSSATIGSRAVLRCSEGDGSPPPTFRWYKDGTLVPSDPKSSPAFRNSSYSLDAVTGELVSVCPPSRPPLDTRPPATGTPSPALTVPSPRSSTP